MLAMSRWSSPRMGPEGTFDARWDSPIAHALRDCAGHISRQLGHGTVRATG